MTKFQSRLAEKIILFLEFKHSIGIIYKTGEWTLCDFDRYNLEHGNYDYLEKETVEGWIHHKKERSKSQYMGYMSYIRELGKYMNSQDNISYILSDKYKAVRYKSNVYLFSDVELQRFFNHIDIYSKTASTIRLSIVLPALFRFLYYFGTRCKEARVLETKNVHLDLGYIDIVATKTHCDRRIFMNDESIEFFRRYHSTMSRITPNRKYFFSDIADRYYPSNAVSSYFNKIWDQAGLRKDTEVRPRAYDLRHYFACKNILKWSSNNENVMAKLPYLMTIMGHSNIESTYYYIHLIPDFFPKYNDLSLLSSELIPEVVEDEI